MEPLGGHGEVYGDGRSSPGGYRAAVIDELLDLVHGLEKLDHGREAGSHAITVVLSVVQTGELEHGFDDERRRWSSVLMVDSRTESGARHEWAREVEKLTVVALVGSGTRDGAWLRLISRRTSLRPAARS